MSRVNDFIYNSFMGPIERNRLGAKRKQLLSDVAGDVLEIGFGTGANLKHYNYEQLDALTLIEYKLPGKLNLKHVPSNIDITILEGDVSSLPFENESFDSVVFTLVFCTIEDPMKGLSEIYRVLKPSGRIYFMEHIKPTKEPYKKVFNVLTPIWKRVSHGCHLNRETMTTIEQSGFRLMDYHRFYRTSFAVGVAYKF